MYLSQIDLFCDTIKDDEGVDNCLVPNNETSQEKICHENNGNDDDDDVGDDDDSTDNSETDDDDDDDDIDVDEEDDDDDDEEDDDGGGDEEEEDNRAEQYKCNKTTLNVPNIIGSTGIVDNRTNLCSGIGNSKLMNKKHDKQLSHSISCSDLYTHTNCNDQHDSQPQITRQQQHQQPHSKLTHEQVNMNTYDENNTTNRCQHLPPGVVVEHQQTPLNLKNNNHDGTVTTEKATLIKLTESTKLMNMTCKGIVLSETNNQTQKQSHVHVQNNELKQQDIENSVVVSAIKCKLNNDLSSMKQAENSKNSGNSRISTPMKPRQPPIHTQYPHGYEKLYLLPNSGDIQKVTGACRHRVISNHSSNKSATVSQQLGGPITTTTVSSAQIKHIKQYFDSRTCTKLPNANDHCNNRVILPNNVNYQNEHYPDPNKSQLNYYSDTLLLPPPSSNQRMNTSSTLPQLSHCQQSMTNQFVSPTVSTASTTAATTATTTTATVFSGSVIGGSGPSSFFTSQMTAFKIWLQTADERRPVATQLPILLQVSER
ncbi:unnamed protein product [Schistosoma mattheei]|uniref:Uncharacterized protein n=1 Tax=Schistosoma mattheei TaxID=31246 RepID=A0A183PZV7_9TREM|nr:unnamed protein product [Schistosoma mattheei]